MAPSVDWYKSASPVVSCLGRIAQSWLHPAGSMPRLASDEQREGQGERAREGLIGRERMTKKHPGKAVDKKSLRVKGFFSPSTRNLGLGWGCVTNRQLPHRCLAWLALCSRRCLALFGESSHNLQAVSIWEVLHSFAPVTHPSALSDAADVFQRSIEI